MAKKKIEENIIEQVKTPQKTTRKDIEFYSTGITLLDLILQGGLAKGRISNVIGWEASGKTIFACETLGYNHNKNKDFKHKYDDAERGFTIDTKEMYNYSTDFIVPFSDSVEKFMFNFEKSISKLEKKSDFIYVLDSLDGLTDDREKKKHKKDMNEIKKAISSDKDTDIKGDYSGKAKLVSQFLRMYSGMLENTNAHLLITSQLRDKPGVMFGKAEGRSGGKALQFYSGQVLELQKKLKITKKITVEGYTQEYEVGRLVKVVCTKNKFGKSFRKCFLFFDFNYGIDNVKSNIHYLYNLITEKSEIREKKLIWDEKEYTVNGLIRFIEKNNLEKELENRVIKLWNEIEEKLTVERKRKY